MLLGTSVWSDLLCFISGLIYHSQGINGYLLCLKMCKKLYRIHLLLKRLMEFVFKTILFQKLLFVLILSHSMLIKHNTVTLQVFNVPSLFYYWDGWLQFGTGGFSDSPRLILSISWGFCRCWVAETFTHQLVWRVESEDILIIYPYKFRQSSCFSKALTRFTSCEYLLKIVWVCPLSCICSYCVEMCAGRTSICRNKIADKF